MKDEIVKMRHAEEDMEMMGREEKKVGREEAGLERESFANILERERERERDALERIRIKTYE